MREIQHHDIWIHRYELKALVPMSSRATSLTRSGALLRIERGPGAPGFSDLHPWPELGDLNLNEQLARLKGNAEAGRTDLLRRALILADLDREAREKNISAFKGLIIPRSHALISGRADEWSGRPFEKRLAELKANGFTTLKFKIGYAPKDESAALNSMHSQLLGMRVRLDANASFSADQFKEFAHSLNPSVRSTIEFIEDPTDSPTEWRALRTELMLPFAFDRGAWPENPTDAFDWVVIKPAIQNPARVASQAKLYGINMCVTSYLDHPVGQMGAALEAARLVRQSMNVGTCGLLSHSAYEASDFSMALQTRGPELMPSSDIGIGFTDLLENLQWERL